MALASLGALLAMSVTLLVNLYMQRDLAREWTESLRVKQPLPLGEKAISRLWHDKHESKTETEDKRQ
jgi:putative membrane protein